jgi:hypothetical protein
MNLYEIITRLLWCSIQIFTFFSMSGTTRSATSVSFGDEEENEEGVREGRARLWEEEERSSASNL